MAYPHRSPLCHVVDGIPLSFSFRPDVFRSALTYEARSDDLFVVTFPKCGTTWLQNVVSCILRSGRPFSSVVEFFCLTPFLDMMGSECVEKMRRPGCIKTHLPFDRVPWHPRAKYVYMARNPKDCCVSFYHHTVASPVYEFEGGSFDEFFEHFMEGRVTFGDYFEHLLSWYERRNEQNVLLLTYEDLKQDTAKQVLRIADFIGPEYKKAMEKDKTLLDDVVRHSSFDYMKKNQGKYLSDLWTLPRERVVGDTCMTPEIKKFVSRLVESAPGHSNGAFVRKGNVGDWRNYFSPEQSSRMEEKLRRTIAGMDLPLAWNDAMGQCNQA